MDSKVIAINIVKTQLHNPTTLIARGRGPCRNNSAPIMVGIGPENKEVDKHVGTLLRETKSASKIK